MRRASTLAAAALAATGLLTLADTASAQSVDGAGEARGLRYLSWPGRSEAADPADREAIRPAAVRADLRRPNPVIPHGGFAAAEPPSRGLTPAPGSARRTLTPANAWLRPRPSAPAPAPSSPSPPAPAAAPVTPPPPPPPGPEYLPDQGGRAQPAPAEVVYAAPARPDEVAPATVSDPMAPRRDAPIFHMQRNTPPAPQPETGAPAREPDPPLAARPDASRVREGARYYSVHRLNGREPDDLVMPAPTYVDALVVSSIDTLASQDLAEPEQGPTLIRDRNGNMRAAPAASDGDHK